VLFPIIERQIYYHTTVHFSTAWRDCNFEQDRLTKLVSENPRILNYVRILEIHVVLEHTGENDHIIVEQLEEFAETLLLFPSLECIILSTPKIRFWEWPDNFRAALEDRLKLPTVKEVHFVGNQGLPFSLIGNCKNIENILLEGVFEPSDEEEEEDLTPLQLKSLTLSDISHSLDAEQLHIKKLKSLKCSESSVEMLSSLLGECAETLNKLDIDLTYSRCKPQCFFFQQDAYTTETLDSTNYSFKSGKVKDVPFGRLSHIPPNLQELIIRAPVLIDNEFDDDLVSTPKQCWSYLPAVADIVLSLIPPPQSLIIDIKIHLFDFSSNLANVDFSPLAALGTAALSISQIDLYVHTDNLPPAVTHAQILSSLMEYEDVTGSIMEGTIKIHAERAAPGYVED